MGRIKTGRKFGNTNNADGMPCSNVRACRLSIL